MIFYIFFIFLDIIYVIYYVILYYIILYIQRIGYSFNFLKNENRVSAYNFKYMSKLQGKQMHFVDKF